MVDESRRGIEKGGRMETIGQLLPQMHSPPAGPTSRSLVDRLAEAECPALTLRRARRSEQAGAEQDPIVWHSARDCNVVDADGNRYVDMSAGFGAAAVGHGHPKVVAAIAKQAATLLHALGDLQPSEVKVQLLSRLAGLAPFEDARVILGLHGADAIEAALKTALLYTGRPGVLAFEGGYHGLSHGVLPLCGYKEAFRKPFAAQLSSHVAWAPFPEGSQPVELAIAQVLEAIEASPQAIGAVVVEPLQGRGGVRVPPPRFLAELSALCRSREILLVADEVMTGLGRTGPRFLSVEGGAEPDLICLGKALGGGLPTSACLGRAEVMAAWGDPSGEALHTATFLGNPLLGAAALAALDVLDEQRLGDRARRSGEYLADRLQQLAGRFEAVKEIRGQGLLQGVVFDRPGMALSVMQDLLERGFITVPAGAAADVLSLTPPLTVTQALLDAFVDALGQVLVVREQLEQAHPQSGTPPAVSTGLAGDSGADDVDSGSAGGQGA